MMYYLVSYSQGGYVFTSYSTSAALFKTLWTNFVIFLITIDQLDFRKYLQPMVRKQNSYIRTVLQRENENPSK